LQKAKEKLLTPLKAIIPLLAVLFLIVMWMTPLMMPHAFAVGQLTSRSLTITSGVPSASGVTYTFTFTVESTTQVQGLKFKACTNAVGTYPNGTCTAPTGFTGAGNGFSNAAFNNQSSWQGATNFAVDSTGANDCVPSQSNILCANRTDTTSQTVTSRTISFNTIKNPSSTNTAFYVGIYSYSTNNYTIGSRVDFGATASATVQTLTTAAAVAEVLNFCIGSTIVNDTTTSVATDCTAMTGTSLNLGTLDSSQTNISPWATDGGDSNNGVAMVRSNAGNGTVIAYDAIPILNSGSTTSYTCAYGPSGNSCNLEPLSNYLGSGGTGTEAFGTGNGFAWNETGTAVNIASSSSSTIKQIDDEALILKFAATPSITTPFGQYQAQTDFIAVPTY
jgi:hypothetical protein